MTNEPMFSLDEFQCVIMTPKTGSTIGDFTNIQNKKQKNTNLKAGWPTCTSLCQFVCRILVVVGLSFSTGAGIFSVFS